MLKIPKETSITAISQEWDKIITEDFINFLPEDIKWNLKKVLNLASHILWHSSSYLKNFCLWNWKKVSKILSKTENDFILEDSQLEKIL